jgi:hypothetical protein
MAPDDKQPSGGQEGGSDGGGEKKPSAPTTQPPIKNPTPPKADPGGVSVRWEIPKPWKRGPTDL